MKLKEKIKNDSYIQDKKNSMQITISFFKHTVFYIVLVFITTLISSLSLFISTSYFNNNAKNIEARAISNSNEINEIALKSTINSGIFPNDIFASPDDNILYLQKKYANIKTFKVYQSYEEYRGTDLVNGFYYHGNPSDKPNSTYEDRFNDQVRYYTDFLCLNDGAYLDIQLAYSSYYKASEDGTKTYKFLKSYIGNEIYLPYTFANDILLPAYKDGYLKNETTTKVETLEDLIDKKMTLYSVMSDRFTVDEYIKGQTESPRTYIIKGIMKENTDEKFSKYFIIPFESDLLTQPRVYFLSSSSFEENLNYFNSIDKFNATSTLNWTISTPFSEPINTYIKSNTPAKKVGIFGSITFLLVIIDGYFYYLLLRKATSLDNKKKKKLLVITTLSLIVISIILGGTFAKMIDGSSLFSWKLNTMKLKTAFFTTSSSLINTLFGIVIAIISFVGTHFYLKNKESKENKEN